MFKRLLMTAMTAAAISVLAGSASRANSWLDLTTVIPGNTGSFEGTLGNVMVQGAITTPAEHFQFNPQVGAPSTWEASTTDNSTPQFSYGNIFRPSTPLTDRVGYTSFSGSVNLAKITVNFSSAVVDPVFEVANLDAMQYDFTGSAGLTGLSLLSSNGALLVNGDVISALYPFNGVGQNPDQAPLTTGFRSGYGSVELIGSITSLTIGVVNPSTVGDGGSFTLATGTPEPGAYAMIGSLGMAGVALLRRRRVR